MFYKKNQKNTCPPKQNEGGKKQKTKPLVRRSKAKEEKTKQLTTETLHIDEILTASKAELQGWITKYPAVPIYRAALAKLLENSKDYTYNEVLKNTSLHVPDRKVLYHFIQKKTTPPLEIEDELLEIEETEVKEAFKIEDKLEVVEEQSELVSEEIEEEVAVVAKENISVEEEVTPELENEAIEENLEVVQNREEESIIEEKLEQTSIESKQVEVEEEVETTTAVKEVVVQETEEEHSFEDWLDFLDDHDIETDSEEQLSEQIEVHLAASTYVAELSEEITEVEQQDEEEDALSEADALQVTNLATDSITLTTGAVTETLAKIMLMQGKINEAIAMYKQLGLKFPEKSNYFAAQIELIKKK